MSGYLKTLDLQHSESEHYQEVNFTVIYGGICWSKSHTLCNQKDCEQDQN